VCYISAGGRLNCQQTQPVRFPLDMLTGSKTSNILQNPPFVIVFFRVVLFIHQDCFKNALIDESFSFTESVAGKFN